MPAADEALSLLTRGRPTLAAPWPWHAARRAWGLGQAGVSPQAVYDSRENRCEAVTQPCEHDRRIGVGGSGNAECGEKRGPSLTASLGEQIVAEYV